MLRYQSEPNEFRELVESVSKALKPGSILFELERSRMVERTPRGVRLHHEVVWSGPDVERGLRYLARDIDLLTCAVEENLVGGPDVPNLHMRTEYDNVALEHLPIIRRWFVDQGRTFHRKARKFLAQFDRDVTRKTRPTQDPGGRGLVAIGGFSVALETEDRPED